MIDDPPSIQYSGSTVISIGKALQFKVGAPGPRSKADAIQSICLPNSVQTPGSRSRRGAGQGHPCLGCSSDTMHDDHSMYIHKVFYSSFKAEVLVLGGSAALAVSACKLQAARPVSTKSASKRVKFERLNECLLISLRHYLPFATSSASSQGKEMVDGIWTRHCT